MGCVIRRLPRSGKLALALHWKMPPHGPVYRTQERTGLADTARNRALLDRDYCAPVRADMRRHAFGRERYLYFFPAGARAMEFRAALALPTMPSALPTPAPLSVADYFATWSERKREPHVRRSRARDYRQHFTAYILPSIGNEAMAELRLDHLVALRDRLTDRGLSIKTVRNVLASSLKAMLREAQAEGLTAAYALFASLELGPAGYYQPDPFSLVERAALLAFYRDYQGGRHYPLVLALALTGMRPSETTALRVADFDAVRWTLSVNKSRNLGTEYDLPKTRKSRRLLPVAAELAELLGGLVADVDPSRHLFVNARGLPVNQDNWRADHWALALKSCDIRHRDLYALRDTFISSALTEGAKPVAVADYCGTSLQMIDQSYGKYIPREPREMLAFVQGSGTAKTQPVADAVTLSEEKPLRGGASPTGFENILPLRRARHTLDEKRNSLGELVRLVGGYRRVVA